MRVDRAVAWNDRRVDGDDVDIAKTCELGIALADVELDEPQLAVFNLGKRVRSSCGGEADVEPDEVHGGAHCRIEVEVIEVRNLSETNPWLQLPAEPPYLLSTDRPFLDSFNEKAGDRYRIHAEIVPEPYLGNPEARVVLLNLNPGFVETDCVVHLDPRFNDAARANLEHRYPGSPFYLLDPKLPESPGWEWWMKKLRALIAASSLEAVARQVFVAEIHGYHSRRFSARFEVPSQQYTRLLVLAALERRAVLVVMRGLRHWMELVPELREGATFAVVRNWRNPTISPGNLANFNEIVEAVRPHEM